MGKLNTILSLFVETKAFCETPASSPFNIFQSGPATISYLQCQELPDDAVISIHSNCPVTDIKNVPSMEIFLKTSSNNFKT